MTHSKVDKDDLRVGKRNIEDAESEPYWYISMIMSKNLGSQDLENLTRCAFYQVINVKIYQPALMAKGHDEVVEMITTLFTKFDLTLSSAQTDKFYEFINDKDFESAYNMIIGTIVKLIIGST